MIKIQTAPSGGKGHKGPFGYRFNHLLGLRKLPNEERTANSGAEGSLRTLLLTAPGARRRASTISAVLQTLTVKDWNGSTQKLEN